MKKLSIYIIGLLLISLITSVEAQKVDPVNSNYLISRGISPRVLDAAADILLQEGSFVENMEFQITKNGGSKKYNMILLYDPKYKYGEDVRFVVNQSDFNKSEVKSFKKAIEKSHRYSRLSRNYLYDESTLKLVQEGSDEIVLEYYYQKQDLEPDLKRIKRFKGQIFLKNDKLEKVIITSTKPLKGNVSNFERTIYYESIAAYGGHIVSSIEEKYLVTKGKDAGDYIFNYTTAEYSNPQGEKLSWSGQKDVQPVFDSSVATDTINVSLGGVLPIFGKPATKLGFGLPRPVGVSIIRHQQTTNLQFTDLQVGGSDGVLTSLKDLFDLESSSLEQPVNTWMVRPDVWVFPFLNVYGILGKAEAQVIGNIVLDPEIRQTIVALAPFLGLNPDDIPSGIPLDIDVSINTVGFGATLAGAVGDFIITANYQLVNAAVPEANTSTISHVLMPLVGYRTPLGLSIMVGAMGQFYDTNIVGFAPLDGGERLNYSVNFEPRTWNGIIGVYKGFGKHWEIVLNAGFGDRTSTTASFGYRF